MASTVPLPQGLTQQWRAFRRGPPGRRFLGSYERHQRSAKKGHWAGKLLCVGGGALLIVLGLVFTLIPGPAILFFLVGGGLLARESPNVARAMDWIEVRVRAVASWCVRHWQALAGWQRGVLTVVGGALAAGVAYAVYWFFFRH